MWAYATATLRRAWRSPMSWALVVLGGFLGWFAATAAVLALDEVGRQGEPLTLSTAHLVAALLTVWLVGRAGDEDRLSGFAAAADATRPGHRGRLLGRWAGAAGAGTCAAAATGLLIAGSTRMQTAPSLLLLSTSIMVAALVGAWAVLLSTCWRGAGAMLAVVLLYVLGHLPWGAQGFLDGPLGRAAGAVLPGPRSAAGWDTLGYTSAAVAGLLLVSLAWSRPADA